MQFPRGGAVEGGGRVGWCGGRGGGAYRKLVLELWYTTRYIIMSFGQVHRNLYTHIKINVRTLYLYGVHQLLCTHREINVRTSFFMTYIISHIRTYLVV